ncbi:DUF6297 family protein [Isoptericola sp. b441]|uniref:DUF6297 family protein n=1 Tax=Actinotalea lenta TaxID=3064654 RepID=A0ABT9DBD3_9CELL|nr:MULTISPECIES: DUF6297 family protein [unclassified Isoptericola]MDO8108166.1 DUF6297 family protein [Isoptericola sp. b441]MDO8120163.1 DUF6297 family protein [Isoptericola sp. b490]
MSELAVRVGGEPTPVPAARSIRGYTAAVARSRAGAGIGSLLGDVYYAGVMIGVGVLLALGALQQLPVRDAPVAVEGSTSLAGLAAVLMVAVVGAVLGTAGRLGPIGVGGAEATWWLTLPVDRRGLLRGSVWRLPALAALVTGLVAGVLAAVVPAVGNPAQVGLMGALAAATLVITAALVQAWRGSRVAVVAGDVLLATVPVLGAGAVLAGWHPATVPAVPWWTLAPAVLALTGLVWWLDTRLGAIPARSLRESGSVAAHAAGALTSMDSRELGRALTDRTARQSRRRSLRMRLSGGAVRALLTADLLVLLRSPRHLVQIVAGALLPYLVVSTPELAGPAQLALAVLIGGYLATQATGEAARRAEMTPAVDRLLPLSARDVRRAHLVVPATVMTLWAVVALAAVGIWHGEFWPWLVLALVAGPAWAGGALRSAYRPAPSWDKALVSTPMGAVPMGAAAVLARGPDVVIVGQLPALVAVLVGSVPPSVLGVQVATTVVALLWGSSTETRSLMDRLAEAQDATSTPRR